MATKSKLTKLKAWRLENGLLTRDAAQQAGISQATWCRAENAQNQTRVTIAEKISKLTGIPLKDIIYGKLTRQADVLAQETEVAPPVQRAAPEHRSSHDIDELLYLLEPLVRMYNELLYRRGVNGRQSNNRFSRGQSPSRYRSREEIYEEAEENRRAGARQPYLERNLNGGY